MSVSQLHQWRLEHRGRSARGEAAIREAIAAHSATLTIGHYRFLYKDAQRPHGGRLLSLTPLLPDGEPDVLDGCVAEQHVPPRLADLDEGSDAELVAVLGAALFRDVAQLVNVIVRPA